ncbi:MAG: hypothetical protein HUU35_16395 [Armatimonadetes bacterium]|nr:hypothetical protein [Armatimonadota bacterium]
MARVWYVPDPQPVGEVAVPLPANGWRPWPGTRYWTLLVEVSVPDEAPAGDYQTVCRWAGREFPVRLTVWNHALPDQLGFDVSLNSYGTVHGKFGIGEAGSDAALAVERAYHRLAHEHRLTWTPLTYGHSGRVEWGAAPRLSGEGEALSGDFEDFDRRFALLLDGSAFADLPRAGVPLDHLYLPFHEQWPGPMSDYAFRASTTAWPAALTEHALLAPPIEQAFPATYATRFEAAVGLFARHIAARGWRQTQFQGYLNNKYDYRDPARGGRGTSWWLLDEPMHRDDWLALAWFAHLFQRGASGTPNLVFRADISRPQWQRQWLDGLVDLAVLGGAWYDHPERTGRWLAREGAVGWHYATANPVGAPNTDAVAWCLRAWLLGADGIVPWNSVGDEAHFERPEATALLLPGRRFGISGPVGSLRLKAFRAGQQEVERLRLLAAQGGYRRAQLKAALAPLLSLEAEFRRAFAEDAGVQSFNLTPDAIERLRRAVAAALEERA